MKMIQDHGRAAVTPNKSNERIRIGIALTDFNNGVQLFFSVIDSEGAHRWTTMEQFDGGDTPDRIGERLRRLADAIEQCPIPTTGETP